MNKLLKGNFLKENSNDKTELLSEKISCLKPLMLKLVVVSLHNHRIMRIIYQRIYVFVNLLRLPFKQLPMTLFALDKSNCKSKVNLVLNKRSKHNHKLVLYY